MTPEEEVAHWKAKAQEACDHDAAICLKYNSVLARSRVWQARALAGEEAQKEHDAAAELYESMRSELYRMTRQRDAAVEQLASAGYFFVPPKELSDAEILAANDQAIEERLKGEAKAQKQEETKDRFQLVEVD